MPSSPSPPLSTLAASTPASPAAGAAAAATPDEGPANSRHVAAAFPDMRRSSRSSPKSNSLAQAHGFGRQGANGQGLDDGRGDGGDHGPGFGYDQAPAAPMAQSGSPGQGQHGHQGMNRGQSPKKRSASQRATRTDAHVDGSQGGRGHADESDANGTEPPAHKRQRVIVVAQGPPQSGSTPVETTAAMPRPSQSYAQARAHPPSADTTSTAAGSDSAASTVSSASSTSTSSSDSTGIATARAAAQVVAKVLASSSAPSAHSQPHPPPPVSHNHAPAPPTAAAAPTLPMFNPSHPPRSDWCPVIHVALPFSTAVLTSSRTLTSAARALAASNADRHRSQSPGSPFTTASPLDPPLPPANRLVTSTPPPSVPCLPLRIAGYAGQAHDISSQGTPTSLLQVNQFTLHALMPRSICAALHAAGISPALQFDVIGSVPPGERPRPRVPSQLPLVEEMKHMRKSLLVTIPPATSDPQFGAGPPAPHAAGAAPDVWELHLKVNATGHQLDGYLIPRAQVHGILTAHGAALLRARRLPLVLDLDDTIVRVATAGAPAPPADVLHGSHAPCEGSRSHRLPCGKSVIVSSDAPKFLAWAATKFEVAVCSLGEQLYVDQVCGLLDPDGSKITGPRFSARQEYNYVSKNGADRAAVLRKPVKSLAAMYPFAAVHPLHPDATSAPGAGVVVSTSSAAQSAAADGNHRGSAVASPHVLTVRSLGNTGVPSPGTMVRQGMGAGAEVQPLPAAVGIEVAVGHGQASLRTIPLVLGELIAQAARGLGMPMILEDQYRPWPQSHHDNIILVDRNRQSHAPSMAAPPAHPTDPPSTTATTTTGPWDVCLFPVVASLLDRVHAGYFRKLEDWLNVCDRALRQAALAMDPVGAAHDLHQSGVLPPGLSVNLPSPPTVVQCYKQLLKEVVRSQIAMGREFSVPGFWVPAAAMGQQAQQAPQQQQQQQQQAQRPEAGAGEGEKKVEEQNGVVGKVDAPLDQGVVGPTVHSVGAAQSVPPS